MHVISFQILPFSLVHPHTSRLTVKSLLTFASCAFVPPSSLTAEKESIRTDHGHINTIHEQSLITRNNITINKEDITSIRISIPRRFHRRCNRDCMHVPPRPRQDPLPTPSHTPSLESTLRPTSWRHHNHCRQRTTALNNSTTTLHINPRMSTTSHPTRGCPPPLSRCPPSTHCRGTQTGHQIRRERAMGLYS